ncbi:MAG: DUF3455 domain-containing protein [Kofleriaceae bacterium]
MSIKLSLVTGALAMHGFACAVDEPVEDVAAAAEQESSQADQCPANTPPVVAPAADADLAFVLDAQGVQRYTCVGSTTGFTWTFIAPDADLFTGNPHEQAVHHFAGPTWVYKDSSSVVAAKAAGSTVDATAIPWLLLNVTTHGGREGRLSDITQIQRLETTGGNAPATGCDADHVGAESDVLYTARYFFYRTSNRPHRVRCGG